MQQEPRRNAILIGAAGSVFGHSGEFHWAVSDLTIPATGIPFQFLRSYRSDSTYQGPLGFGWDHSYNQWIEQSGQDAVYHDGLGRTELFAWSGTAFVPAQGVYATLEYDQPSDHYTLRWRQGTVATFAKQGGSLYRLIEIEIRTGQSIQLQYSNDRLSTILDAHGRVITLLYDPSGRLDTVTDWSGREVKYTYSPSGDLASSRTPVSPEFPVGRTTTYGYQAHRLTTITDPKDQTFLTNSYDAPGRVESQEYGSPGQHFGFVYLPGKTTETDRAGNVTDYEFSAAGTLTRRTEYTRGLRSTDPASWVTEYTYNTDFECTRVEFASGRVIEFDFDSGNPDPRAHGNLLEIRRASSIGADPILTASITYDPQFQRVKSHTDWLGRTTTNYFDYEEAALGDLNGDGVTNQTFGNIVETVYPNVVLGQPSPQAADTKYWYDSGGRNIRIIDPEGHVTVLEYYTMPDPSAGYLRRKVEDLGGLNLASEWAYNAVGAIITCTDPCGRTTALTVSPLDSVTQTVAPAPLAYEIATSYDANGQAVRMLVENVDGDGNRDPAMPFIETSVARDLLGNAVSSSRKVSATKHVTTTFTYDANENLRDTVSPLGDVVRSEYDERDLLWKSTRGVGTPDASTVEYDYDGNRSVIRRRSGAGLELTYDYDGYGRLVAVVDPLGNRKEWDYDACDNMRHVRRRAAGGAVLFEEELFYDERGRLYKVEMLHKNSAGVPVGAGVSRQEYLVNRDGLTTAITNTQGRTTTQVFDGAHRLIKESDPLGDVNGTFIQYAYDPCGNTVSEVSNTFNQLTQSFEARTISREFDALSRETRTVADPGVGHLALTVTRKFNSRNLMVQEVAPDGVVKTWAYDGLDRLLLTTMDTGGSSISMGQEWSDDSNRIACIDPNGNRTEYVFDPLGRIKETLFADGHSILLVYDADHQVVSKTDQNGNVVTYTYDPAGLLVQRDIVRGSGVLGASREVLQNDGAGRLVRIESFDGVTSISTVEFAYDTLMNVDRETLIIPGMTPWAVLRVYDNDFRRIAVTYPDGREIDVEFDECLRARRFSFQQSQVAQYEFMGLSPVRRTGPAGATRDMTFDMALRLNRINHRASGGALLEDLEYALSGGSQYRYVSRAFFGAGDAYDYDDTRRVVAVKYGVPNQDFSPQKSYDDYTSFAREERFNLDDAGNRMSRQDGAITDLYNHVGQQYVPDPMNAYFRINLSDLIHDAGGNLREDSRFTYTYNYNNQLLEVRDKATTQLIRSYVVDGMGRRVKATAAGQSRYTAYDGVRAVQDYNQAGAVIGTYVYGRMLDEFVSVEINGVWYSVLQDRLGSTVAVTDAGGAVLERVTYEAFGLPTFRDAAGAPLPDPTRSALGVPFAFAGARWDADTSLYYMRARDYDPASGVFLTRDPVAGIPRAEEFYNVYSYCGGDPVNSVDPLGTWPPKNHKNMTIAACKKVNAKLGEKFLKCKKIAKANVKQDTLWSLVTPTARGEAEHGMSGEFSGGPALIKQVIAEFMAKANKALKDCDMDKMMEELGKALHAAQDSYAHQGMGKLQHYVGTANSWPMGNTFIYHDPDDPKYEPSRIRGARNKTLQMLQDFVNDKIIEIWWKKILVPPWYGFVYPDGTVVWIEGDPPAHWWDLVSQEFHGGTHPQKFGGSFGPLGGESPSGEDYSKEDGLGAPWIAEDWRRAFPVGMGEGIGGAFQRTEGAKLLQSAMYLPEYRWQLPSELMVDALMEADLWGTLTVM